MNNERLPSTLRETRNDFPSAGITICVPRTVGALEAIVALMYDLGKMLRAEDRKFRVTIDYDPQKSAFKVWREEAEVRPTGAGR